MAHRKFGRLEIDSDHRANFEIDEQEKNVGKFWSWPPGGEIHRPGVPRLNPPSALG
jgi:hypothetical protein